MSKAQQQYYNFSKEELRDLFELTKGGDTNSFQELSSLIRTISYSYFKSKYNYGKIHTIDDADDLANDVFIAFAKQYQNILDIEKWLRRVLFLTFVNFYKKQKKHPHFELDEAYDVKAETPDTDISLDSQKAVEILNTLSEKKRDIIRMRFWEGLKFTEIADKLDKNEAAVKKMLYRTLEEIKIKLE